MAGAVKSAPDIAAVPFKNARLSMSVLPCLLTARTMPGLRDPSARVRVEPMRRASVPCDCHVLAADQPRPAGYPQHERHLADTGIDEGVGTQILHGQDFGSHAP